jgi:hypothetical protein
MTRGENLCCDKFLHWSSVFVCTAIAWAILGATIFSRTYGSHKQLQGHVASTWGTSQQQSPANGNLFC